MTWPKPPRLASSDPKADQCDGRAKQPRQRFDTRLDTRLNTLAAKGADRLRLLYRDALGQVAWLVDVGAA